tara:strand:- start:1254 stop:2384 length:1131 start_codon:yes stop_codon:yes gene_type:complete
MLKYSTLAIYTVIALFVFSCASGPSSVQFTSAKTKARSERNLKEAEKYALEALVLEAHQQDAQVPYFLATEVYKPQKKWGKVVEMFDEAMKRDPEAMLSQPYQYEGRIITKMQEQITIYYISELWYILYNKAVKDYDENQTDVEIIELLELAMHVNPNNINTYVLLSKIYDSNEQPDLSKGIINQALNIESITVDEKANLCAIQAEQFKQEGNYTEGINSYKTAYDYYKQADDEDGRMSCMVSILSLNLLLENWDESIHWAGKVYDEDYLISDDTKMDVFFNIALAYNNAASNYYNIAGSVFNSDNPSRYELQEAMNNYNKAFTFFDQARDFFNELDDMGSDNGARMAEQVKNYMEMIEDKQVPFVQKQLDSLNSN